MGGASMAFRMSALLKRRKTGRRRRKEFTKRYPPEVDGVTEEVTSCEESGQGEGETFTDKGAEEEEGSEREGHEPQEDEEEEEEDKAESGAHSQLISAISALGRKRRRGQRSEASAHISPYQLTTEGDGAKVTVAELLGGLGAGRVRGVANLRKRLATSGHAQHQLRPPPGKPQTEKAQRAVAYSLARREVGRWLPIVSHNRRAEHLAFPLQEEAPPLPSLASRVEGFQPMTEMEEEVAAVLAASRDQLEASEEELTVAERRALVQVCVEEARERRRELRRMRVLLSQYEQKRHRERKIKSRNFHRIQRKRRKAHGTGAGEGEGEEVRDRVERLRVRERMTLRHGRQGRWAREVIGRHKKDPAAQAALAEHSTRGKVLTQHSRVEEEDENEGESGAESEQHDPTSPCPLNPSRSTNPWLHQSGPVLLLDGKEDRASEDSDGEEREQLREADMEEQEENFDPSHHLIEGEEEEGGRQTARTPPKQTTVGAKREEVNIDPSAYLRTEKVGGALGVASENILSVYEAFAGDDVMGEFAKEKEEEVEKSKPQDTNLPLPGWGVWGGEGVKPAKKQTQQMKPSKQRQPRKDDGLDHVIISEHENRKIRKHLVSQLPWPYSTREQFNRSHCSPVGRQWNSEVVFRQMISPRVESGVGRVIPPLRMTEDVEGFLQRARDRREREGKMKGKQRQGGRQGSREGGKPKQSQK